MSRSFSLWTRRTAAAWGKNPLFYRFLEKALCNKIAALFSKDDAMGLGFVMIWYLNIVWTSLPKFIFTLL